MPMDAGLVSFYEGYMQSMKWVPFAPGWGLPPERRSVLVKIMNGVNECGGVVVGYLRYAAGDRDSPFFVCSAVPGPWTVTHWCDCLGDNFWAPGWASPQRISGVGGKRD